MLRVFSFVLISAIPLAAADVSTLAGKKYGGTITSIADGHVNIRTDAGPIAIPVKEMAAIEFGAKSLNLEKVKYDELELTDGTRIRISGLKIAARKVEPVLRGSNPPALSLPLESVFYWLRGAEETKNREEWKKLLDSRGKRDLFVVREGDRLSPVPGTILNGSAAGDAIEFERESDNAKATFKLARATGGLVFNQPPRGIIPPTLCKLYDIFGNVLVVETLKLAGESVEARTVSGAVVSYSSLEGVAKLDFSTGNISYLSDRTPEISAPPAPPASEKGIPQWKVLNDATIDGPGFKLREVGYTRGLQIPPEFVLTYKLNSEFREFKAVAGIDDRIPELPLAVRLTIEADSKPVFSELIKRTDKPRELTLDVKNVKTLTIRVDPDGTYAMCQIALADARLQK